MLSYIRNDKYDAAHFDNEWVILNTDKFTVTKINEIGGFCWSLLEQSQTVDTLAQAIRKEYEVMDDTLEEDLHNFLSDLLKFNLIDHAN